MIEEDNEEVVLRIDEVVMTMEDLGEEDLVTTEEAMEAAEEVVDMKIEGEVETNQAATLILADAIEEIQTGDLPLKMILERPPQRSPRSNGQAHRLLNTRPQGPCWKTDHCDGSR